jgi:hypothetical protein
MQIKLVKSIAYDSGLALLNYELERHLSSLRRHGSFTTVSAQRGPERPRDPITY